MIQRITCILIAALAACANLSAQLVCPSNFPSPSPVLSSALDDIPATGEDIVTYTGAYAKAQANHNVNYVQISSNDQRVWFISDGSPGIGKAFYNRRYRADANSPWYWQYSVSPAVIVSQLPDSSGPASVLYSNTAKYRDSASGTYYQFLMYQVFQPGACDGANAVMNISFSNDGI